MLYNEDDDKEASAWRSIFNNIKGTRSHTEAVMVSVSHLGPGLVDDRFLFNEVALDSLSSISVRELPDQPHSRPGDVGDLQVLWRSGNICSHKQNEYGLTDSSEAPVRSHAQTYREQ